MSLVARAATALVVLAAPAVAGTAHFHAKPATVNGVVRFSSSPMAQAGTIAPGGSKTFYVYTPVPDMPVYINYATNGGNTPLARIPGDETLLPASQCGGVSVLNDWTTCTSDSLGRIALTYVVPSPVEAQGSTAWIVNTGPNTYNAYTHYVSADIYRFDQSPLAAAGSLAPGQVTTANLTIDDSLDQGVPGAPAYLSFVPAPGGGSASAGGVPLTATPTEVFADATGTIPITYTAPATLPASGVDQVVAQDLPSSPTEVSTSAYAFAAGTPVISIGDVSVGEAQVKPTAPAKFTVTVTPTEPYPVSFSWVNLCGMGDKWCFEDIRVVTNPVTVTIPAGHSSTTVTTQVDSYGGAHGGEDYNEGWFLHLTSAGSGAILGRSMGEGVMLDTDNAGVALLVGDASTLPTSDAKGTTVYFTVTCTQPQSYPVSFQYSTADGTAVAGADYDATSGTGTIPPGSNTTVIPVHIDSGSSPAADRSFSLIISNASVNIVRPTGIGTLLAG